MKTSKEMQLKVLRKMHDNIDADKNMFHDIQYFSGKRWSENHYNEIYFNKHEYRIKPQTITINGVEIPKPLDGDDIKSGVIYYYVDNNKALYEQRYGEFIHAHGIRFVYRTEQEAIEASKLLFGIED